MSDWNDKVIAEFHDNGGKVGGMFDGANMVLLHHVGRKSGEHYIAPVVWFDGGPATIYVVASAAGAPANPQWYENLVAAGRASIEVGHGSGAGGIDLRNVIVTDLQGAERDRVFDEIVAQSPGFGDYAAKTEGIRTIPVLALRSEVATA